MFDRAGKRGLARKSGWIGSSDLLVYIGHNGLMDFTLTATPQKRDDRNRQAIILACASKQYFSPALKSTGASPLVWTTNGWEWSSKESTLQY